MENLIYLLSFNDASKIGVLDTESGQITEEPNPNKIGSLDQGKYHLHGKEHCSVYRMDEQWLLQINSHKVYLKDPTLDIKLSKYILFGIINIQHEKIRKNFVFSNMGSLIYKTIDPAYDWIDEFYENFFQWLYYLYTEQ